MDLDPYLVQAADTRRFSLGLPRNLTVSPDGRTVLFTRTRSGRDPVSCLWKLDVGTGNEELLADPVELLGDAADNPTPEELVRRERARERSTGITSYATDGDVRHAVFALNGRLWRVDVASGHTCELPTTGPVDSARLDKDFGAVAYVTAGALHLIDLTTGDDRTLVVPETPDITYGVPEHVAGESMDRFRAYWWSPDGQRLVATRVDNSPVATIFLADPGNPEAQPSARRYPLAGTANAEVRLQIFGRDGERVEVDWDPAYEYVVTVAWTNHDLLAVVQNRSQTTMTILAIDPDTGKTTVVREDHDAAWTTITTGVPARMTDGRLVWVAESDNTRRLVVGDEPVTPVGLQVRTVLSVDGDDVLFVASSEQTEDHLWAYAPDAGARPLTTVPGVHSGASGGGTTVIASRTLDRATPRFSVQRDGKEVAELRSLVETPVVDPRPTFFHAGEHELRTAVLFPAGHVPGSKKLPVLMDPYGGPGGRRVLTAAGAFVDSQWWADQGYVVIVADGRGTPERDPDWSRTIHRNKEPLSLIDQIVALHAAAEKFSDLDLDRVGMRGWSYSGFLSALAVLRRPDVFHVAVAGAPVTDKRIYDTHYQERYFGHPDEYPDVYEQCSIVGDAPKLDRPLMLIHGLADDNVLPVHTLKLSAALTAAARPHTTILLSGLTHMPSDRVTLCSLSALQADFLARTLKP